MGMKLQCQEQYKIVFENCQGEIRNQEFVTWF